MILSGLNKPEMATPTGCRKRRISTFLLLKPSFAHRRFIKRNQGLLRKPGIVEETGARASARLCNRGAGLAVD
jgi:hypothetical protein